MTTCTTSSKKKQAKIREKRMGKYERVLERCKQIPGGFEQKAMAIQVFATPVLCFDSEHALHGNNSDEAPQESARDPLQVHKTEVSSADIHIVGKRAPDPSELSCEKLVYQNSEKSIARKNRFARGCRKPYQSK